MGKAEEKRLFDAQMAKWPVERKTHDQMTQEEVDAVAKAGSVWEIGQRQLSNQTMWKEEKSTEGGIKIHSGKCADLRMKVFKTTCDLPWDIESVHKILMNSEDNPNWNKTLAMCCKVALFPPPASTQDNRVGGRGAAWITYMRLNPVKLISQRDFVSCFLSEDTDTKKTWIGCHIEVSLCPKAPNLVRGEQNIMTMHLEKLDTQMTRLTQITSLSLKGALLQSIIDSQMSKSLMQYFESLQKKVEAEKNQ